jgi:hypothetical protein
MHIIVKNTNRREIKIIENKTLENNLKKDDIIANMNVIEILN